MDVRDDRAWFAPKRFGYGSGLPIRWQGWAALAAVMVALVAARWTHGPIRWVTVASVLLAFAALCAFRTRGGWRWRWDGKG